MKTRVILPLLLLGALLAGCSTTSTTPAGTAPGNVTVNYTNPDKFTDVRDSVGGFTDEQALAQLRDYLQRTAARRLTAGQTLTVTFTDIDLAGDFSPTSPADRVRVIRAIYYPRMTLTFELKDANGKVLKQGDRQLADMDFQNNINRINTTESYFHDKELLRRWIDKEFK